MATNGLKGDKLQANFGLYNYMDLFDDWPNPEQSLLPFGGEVYYYGKILNKARADNYFRDLMEKVRWENDRAVIYGKHLVTKRKVAWYADRETSYSYSGTTKTSLAWLPFLLDLKGTVEDKCGEKFNSCLLNLYHNGEEGMSWHSDDEKELRNEAAIASVSLGAERKFVLKHKVSGKKVSLVLGHGSLLIMRGTTQQNWLHQLPKTKKTKDPRINLTFRSMLMD